MKEKLKLHWSRTPHTIRKPLVLVIGLLFIIAAGLLGWLPGPGGIPLFLVGIAILATEFTWAERIKNLVLAIVHYLGRQLRAHRVIGTIIIVLSASIGLTLSYIVYTKFYN